MPETETPRGPEAREAEARALIEENAPLLDDSPSEMVLSRIMVQSSKLLTDLSDDVKLQSERTVVSADRLTEAVKNSKIPAKEVAALEVTYNRDKRTFERRKAAFDGLSEFYDRTKVLHDDLILSSAALDNTVDEPAEDEPAAEDTPPTKRRSLLSRLFGSAG